MEDSLSDTNCVVRDSTAPFKPVGVRIERSLRVLERLSVLFSFPMWTLELRLRSESISNRFTSLAISDELSFRIRPVIDDRVFRIENTSLGLTLVSHG